MWCEGNGRLYKANWSSVPLGFLGNPKVGNFGRNPKTIIFKLKFQKLPSFHLQRLFPWKLEKVLRKKFKCWQSLMGIHVPSRFQDSESLPGFFCVHSTSAIYWCLTHLWSSQNGAWNKDFVYNTGHTDDWLANLSWIVTSLSSDALQFLASLYSS